MSADPTQIFPLDFSLDRSLEVTLLISENLSRGSEVAYVIDSNLGRNGWETSRKFGLDIFPTYYFTLCRLYTMLPIIPHCVPISTVEASGTQSMHSQALKLSDQLISD